MRPVPTRAVLFALALVLSQWLVFAHEVVHPALQVDPHCVICLHAPGIDGGALAALPPGLPPTAQDEVPQPASVQRPLPSHAVRPRIRGPPHRLV